MPYADAAYYVGTYKGTSIPADEQDTYLKNASDAIDQLTYFRIAALGGLTAMTTFQQNQVKLAVCYQADYDYSRKDMPEDVESYNLMGTSVKLGKGRGSSTALSFLMPTGLLYRGL